jgi:hypothetical protein
MAITTMSSGRKCTSGSALNAKRAGKEGMELAEIEAGSNPNILSPELE